MTQPLGEGGDLGAEIFRCRPLPLDDYGRLRYQGELPGYKALKWFEHVIPVISPAVECLLLALMPMVPPCFLLDWLEKTRHPDRPVWVNWGLYMVLVLSSAFSIWWCRISPRKDYLVVYERGLRWQVSLGKNTYWRSRGSVRFEDLSEVSCRSDCFAPEPSSSGVTTADKLTRLILAVVLGRHDMGFRLKNGKGITVDKLFARFEPGDLQRVIEHLEKVTQVQRINI